MLETFSVSTILSISFSFVAVTGLVFLLVKKTKGTWHRYSAWIDTKKYYTWLLFISILYTTFSIIRRQHFIFNVLYNITVNFGANVFLSYYVFCHCRLGSVFQGLMHILYNLGSREQKFWTGFKAIFATLTGIQVVLVTILLSMYVDITSFISDGPEMVWLNILWRSEHVVFIIWGLSATISAIYCFSQMLYIILTSSAKLAKMKRNNEAHLVNTFRKKLFAFVGLAAVMMSIALVLPFTSILYGLIV
jgi:hypothetical protein